MAEFALNGTAKGLPSFGDKKDLPKLLRDPRIDPRVKEMFKGKPWPPLPSGFQSAWSKHGLSIATHQFKSKPDGNSVDVVFVRPDTPDPLPCVVYFHGGGMMAFSAHDFLWSRFARLMAHQGVCVALVDFRNCFLPSRPGKQVRKYPAGLNDCMSALEWVNANKTSLGVGDRVVVAGESGGGNLALAVAMKCKREGKLDLLQGFYASCPYIAGLWPQRAGAEGEIIGSSHLDDVNNGVFLHLPTEVEFYSRSALQAKDPLAWPGFASEEELAGLPPGVIVVDECDPLRDEGLNFYRRLLRARVVARCSMSMGMPHAGHLICMAWVPDVALAAARSIADFAVGTTTVPSKL